MIVSCGEALVDMVPAAVPGGGPMNVAIAAARLGAPAAFVGRISTDSYGELIWAHLHNNGVDLRASERGDEPTARAIVEHTPQVRFRFEGHDTSDTQLSQALLDRLGHGPHLLHGGTLGLFRGRIAEVLASLVERHPGLVSLDPNVRPQIVDDRDAWDHYHERWVRRTHLYKVSDEDADWIWPGRDSDSWIEELLAGAAEAVILTRGGGGAVVTTEDLQVSVEAREVEVVDTVGAGDTFVAAVLAALWERSLAGRPSGVAELSTDQWAAIVGRASDAAAVTCSRAGADPPWLHELPDT